VPDDPVAGILPPFDMQDAARPTHAGGGGPFNRSPLDTLERRPTMRGVMTRAIREECGQDLIEYALLAAFISIVAVAAITSIGSVVNSWYQGYGTTIGTIPSGS
jgi:Flp pilus assembly pilin Flp